MIPNETDRAVQALEVRQNEPARIADQPAPIPNERPAVWSLVIADMRERDELGRHRYGTPLQPFNGRDALVDAYQEALDLAVYLRQAIEERAATRAAPVKARAKSCPPCNHDCNQGDTWPARLRA